MNKIADIGQLSWHSNINTYNYRGKHIVLYDDHRWILNVIFEAMKLTIFNGKIPNIIFFDHHDDACYTDVRLSKYGIDNILEMKSRDFWSLVEFDLSALDDDWVTAGMELGIINNVVCIGNVENNNIQDWDNNSYQTATNVVHKGFSINHLKWEFGSRGVIGDSIVKYPFYQTVREIFGFRYGQSLLRPQHPYVLDFDLDCFTTEYKDTTYAWPKYFFREEFWPKDDFQHRHYIQQLIANASIITICREPECCGGLGESNRILGYLDRYLFDGVLGTEPIQ